MSTTLTERELRATDPRLLDVPAQREAPVLGPHELCERYTDEHGTICHAHGRMRGR